MTHATSRLRTGIAGEEAAARWLERRGFRIEARNWRGRAAEIDLVAWDGGTLVFVEVKARHGRRFGGAAEAVDARKQTRILRAAESFVRRFGSRPPACRFDVVALDGADGGEWQVTHIPDAFRPGWA